MIFLAAFLGELLVLFFLSRALTRNLSLFLYRLRMGEALVMHILAIIFLPGTFIHEMSHYLMSVILRVRVLGMSLLPRAIGGGHIKMGSLTHEEADLFRNLLIGSAPFIIGNLILYFTIFYLQASLAYSTSYNPSIQNWVTLLAVVIVFQIGNSMFSSPTDMEGSVEFLFVLAVIFGISYFFGWRISLEQLDQSIPGSLVSIIKQADLFLLVPLILDTLIIGLIKITANLSFR